MNEMLDTNVPNNSFLKVFPPKVGIFNKEIKEKL